MTAFLVAQRQQVSEIRDHPAIFVCQVRVEGDDRRGGGVRHHRLGLLQLFACGGQCADDRAELRPAVGDGADEAIDLGLRSLDAALGERAVPSGVAIALSADAMELADELTDRLRIEQRRGEGVEHAFFEQMRLDRAGVCASAALTKGGAAPFFLADDGVAAAAGAALRQSGQEALGPPLLMAAHAVEAVPAGRYGVPSRVVDDAKVRRLDDGPLIRRRRANALAAGFRVLKAARLVEDDLAAIEVVLQDAVLAHPITIDGRQRPWTAGGAGDAVRIQSPGNVARAASVKEFGVDAADNRRLGFVDFAKASLQLARRAQLRHAAIAVGVPARAPACQHAPGLAAPRLVGDVLAIEGGHGTLDADVQLADGAVGEGDDAHAGELGALVEFGDVGLVAA